MNVKKMSIDEKMDYIRQALEMGADVSLHFHDCREKEEAEILASKLSELANLPVEYNASRDSTLRWLKIEDRGMETTVFYDEKEVEATA